MADGIVGVIPWSSIIEGDRMRKDYKDIEGLAASIHEKGLIQSIAVKDMEDGTYKLLAGGRRYRACKVAKLKEIPVRIFPFKTNEMEERSIELVENLQREDLTWEEELALTKEIDALHKQIYGEKIKRVAGTPEEGGWSQADTANLMGKSTSSVSLDLELARAVELIPELGQAKTKDEARKLFKKLQSKAVDEEIVQRISKMQADTPEKLLHKKLCDSYSLIDCFEGMKDIPSGSMQIIEVDPPYGIDLTKVKKSDASAAGSKSTADYNEVEAKAYPAFLDKLIGECSRLLTDSGWLIFWFAPEPWFDQVLKTLKKHKFIVKGMPAIWTKTTGQSMQPELNLANAYEMFFYARKGDSRLNKPGINIFDTPPIPALQKTHPTERPIELMERVLTAFGGAGSKVFVPFLGSGNTLLAASNLKMKGMGCDLTSEYKDQYVLKVHSSVPGRYRSLTTTK